MGIRSTTVSRDPEKRFRADVADAGSPRAAQIPRRLSAGTAERALRLHPPGRLKYDSGLAADWSSEDQKLLEVGLRIYQQEPNITRYIKIAASLRHKTVRDVALRCQWMARKKQSTQESFHNSRKMKERKDKQVDYPSPGVLFPVQSPSLTSTAFKVPQIDLTIGDASEHLLLENARILDQIKLNLDTFFPGDNMELLVRAKNNLDTILSRMNKTPTMRKMAGLPVSIDNNTFGAFLLRISGHTV
ncbi:uncharacterized protein LOC144715057 isoform X2 [Wolffia australiana]